MDFQALEKLNKDLKESAALLGQQEARFLVDQYYTIQGNRIRSANQVRQATGEPTALLQYVSDNTHFLEKNIRLALKHFSSSYKVGNWMTSICGIGPVISAGFLAHLDVSKCKTAGHFEKFAGWCPGLEWKKGEKRPWNADLKVLCYKVGESFVKVQNNKNDFYGQLYISRKLQENEKNVALEFTLQAKEKLEKFNIGKTTEAYKYYSQGMLPPAHIHARARRWCVKIFLSHLHHVMYENYFREPPPVPYIFAKSDHDHRHYIEPPNLNTYFDGRRLTELLGESKPEDRFQKPQQPR